MAIGDDREYEYRVLLPRDRWTMGCPYEEWFRPEGRDYDTLEEAQKHLEVYKESQPRAKIQRRPRIEDWTDV